MHNKSGLLFYISFLLAMEFISLNGQRVPPGVPPQHYQQPPPQYQQHPQQPQFQQQAQQNVPPEINQQHYQQPHQVQYQQVPVQQQPPVQPVPVHQPVPVQQVPESANSGPHAPHDHGQQVLNANIQNERMHIQEHMQVPIDTQKMSDTELQFHYFKMHDSDNNNKLDGCELIKSLVHWHEEDKEAKEKSDEKQRRVYTDAQLEAAIDYVFKSMDFNNDGYVDYGEYRKSEQNVAKNN